MSEWKDRTEAEWQAYYDGRRDAEAEQQRCPGSYVVIFERYMDDDDCKAVAGLLRSVRGVVAVLPMEETHHDHLCWREVVEALGGSPEDDHAQEWAVREAAQVRADLEGVRKAWRLFWTMATKEQQATIIREIRPEIFRPPADH